ncbi:MAG: radical SAM protein [Armatimonadetes bacterium]|nr:radical SAM protein [Armatimonadota bacterium]
MPMQPLRGQIMLTYRCSAACRHCLVMAAPQQDPTLVTVADAVEYGRDFQALGRQVLLAGGEALLYFEHVLAICRALREAGVPVGFVESNGSWCTTDERVRARLEQLKEAGVEGMYFSIDAFHQEFVPAERVHRGIRLAREVFGLENVYAPFPSLAEVRALEGVAADPERLHHAVCSYGVHYLGRSADDLAPLASFVPLEALAQENCRADLEIDTLAELQVDPFGYVRPDWCPGVNLGNTRHARLADLARTERVRQDPLLSDLAEGGPAALLPLARRFGITPEPAYASKCHLCFALRRQLVAHLPDAFGPEHVYQICARQ